MQHKYEVGAVLEMIPNLRMSNRPGGACEVLARLPFEGNELQYRVQAVAERNQRIVAERDLRPSAGRAETATQPADMRSPRRF
jgi:nucleoid-associated protein YgaU